jgi:hypothetical protein
MNQRVAIIFLMLSLLLNIFGSCSSTNHNENIIPPSEQPFDTSDEHIHNAPDDTIVLKEATNEEDIIVNEYLITRLKPIRENFKRINSVTQWTFSDTVELWETLEGGEAEFFYLNDQLERIITRHFGETFQLLKEYYLLNGQLSFVLEKSYKYNRPLFYDSTAMKDNNDNQAFDFEKSEVIEDRSYFEKGVLIHQINSQDCGSPYTSDYLSEEQKRIKSDFDKLIKMKKK